MKICTRAKTIIKVAEGLNLEAYKCPAGVWTIGYGHTEGVKQGMKITKKQADEILEKDLLYFQNEVIVYDKYYNFNINEFSALVSFTFNLGPGNLKLLLDGGKRDRKTIREKMLLYNKACGKVLRGLVTRRKNELDLFNSTEGL